MTAVRQTVESMSALQGQTKKIPVTKNVDAVNELCKVYTLSVHFLSSFFFFALSIFEGLKERFRHLYSQRNVRPR